MYVLLGLPITSAERTPIFPRSPHGFDSRWPSRTLRSVGGGGCCPGAAATAAAATTATSGGAVGCCGSRRHLGGRGLALGALGGGSATGTGAGALARRAWCPLDDLALGGSVGAGSARP